MQSPNYFYGDIMINKSTLELLFSAIKEYDKLVGKDFLVGTYYKKDIPLEYIVIRIQKKNFWHLLGCKLLNTKEDIYAKCLNGEDITAYLDYTKTAADSKIKYEVFMRVFNFVYYAKQIRISNTDNSPDYYNFRMASGIENGIIGYDTFRHTNNSYFPKTTQRKEVSSYYNQEKKISVILSKSIHESSFDKLEFSSSERLLPKFISEIPDCYQTKLRDKYLNKESEKETI